jgi:hypothetical protein
LSYSPYNPEDENVKFLGKICELLPDYTALQPRELQRLARLWTDAISE